MGIVSFTHCFSRTPVLSVLLNPLQALMGLFGSASQAPGNKIEKDMPDRLAMSSDLRCCQTNRKDVLESSDVRYLEKPLRNRLKIVRNFELGVGSSYAGRMKISGRMVDVCAELDRMAQHEVTSRHH